MVRIRQRRRWHDADGWRACVLGDMDLVRPLALAGVRCVVAAHPGGARADLSRAALDSLPWENYWTQEEAMVQRLLRFAERQQRPPVLFYQGTSDLLVISRNRDRLRGPFRFVIADVEVVEELTDKARFQATAERLRLPVPPTRQLSPAGDPGGWRLDARFPLILKPVTRRFERWGQITSDAKAVAVPDRESLHRLWPRLAEADVEILAQELVEGPESRIESYHAYVDDSRRTVAEFTGRKIRTRPPEFGFSTSVMITDARDVAALGREVLRRLNVVGVAKVDFKRDADGKLWLLEVNPRFTLWHHPAAVAGVNIPALVWADLTGQQRPPVSTARPGVTWCDLWEDAATSRAAGRLGPRWALWAGRCEAKSGLALDDPMPFLRGVVAPKIGRRLRRSAASLGARWRPRERVESATRAQRSERESDPDAV